MKRICQRRLGERLIMRIFSRSGVLREPGMGHKLLRPINKTASVQKSFGISEKGFLVRERENGSLPLPPLAPPIKTLLLQAL